MQGLAWPHLAVWVISGASVAGVILRPRRLPEALWAVLGAGLLVAAGLLPWGEALSAIVGGVDLYLFLLGMMLLSEVARREGLFDWLAVRAVHAAGGSSFRLFALVYGVGIAVTVVLSNDATAVVLTPAVLAATRAAGVPPLPALFACAFVANAASFVLPISNPANLVLYGERIPPLMDWLDRYALPSLLSIVATFGVLALVERKRLAHHAIEAPPHRSLSIGGRTAGLGIIATAVLLLAVSAVGADLGPPAALAGGGTTALVALLTRQAPLPVLRGLSWQVFPLTAGLFVLVAGLQRTGVLALLEEVVTWGLTWSAEGFAVLASAVVALACNGINNLPAGLIVGTVLNGGGGIGQVPEVVTESLLIAIDLGPNLSVTGSLATILWLLAVRKEGMDVGFWRFLARGVVVMPPAMILAAGAVLLRG